MIIGIGTDIIEIERIEKACQNERFLTKHFSDRELELFKDRQFKAETIASNFAAKESVLKVFGTGLRQCKFIEIEVLRDALGKPYVELSGGAALIAQQLGIEHIHVSVSHSKTNAIGYAIGTGRSICY